MGVVRFGKMPLRWCDSCNLPILEVEECGRCGARTREVKMTPPGDVRPAFHFDVKMIRERIDSQFGDSCGRAAIPDHMVPLLNRCPAVDRMDEVIMDGRVIGTYVFDIDDLDFRFIPRMEVAVAMASSGRLSRGYVKMDGGAVEPVRGGANALAPGILEAHTDIAPGDEVVILSEDGHVLGVGPARMSGPEMLERDRGVGVKNRWYGEADPGFLEDRSAREDEPPSTQGAFGEGPWAAVLEANAPHLEERVGKARDFVERVVREHDLPVAVSYSGGKDSLTTLLLVLETGLEPKILFVDTGLELPETVENVHQVCEAHDLDLLEEKAGDAFWEALPIFGPPAKDFRWCCKTCKLGPVSRLISENFPEGVLTFIGQRSFESFQRRDKGPVWRNPWVDAQVGASPIQDWPALLVWLFLFSRSAEVNPLYASGNARIGCWLCPASNMGDMVLVEGNVDPADLARFRAFLQQHAERWGYSRRWLTMGLWRWRKPPPALREFSEDCRPTRRPPVGEGRMRLVMSEGYTPCTGGISAEGAFTGALDMDRVRNLLHTVGKVEGLDVGNGLRVEGWAEVYPEGAMVVRGGEPDVVRKRSEAVRRAVLRAMECLGCGVCLGRCPEDALSLQDGRVVVNVEACVSCGRCGKRCPVTDFGGTGGPDEGF